MKILKFVLIGVLSTVVLIGCTQVSGEDQVTQDFEYNYEIMNPTQLNDNNIKQWYEDNRKNYGFYEYQQDAQTHYLLIGAGQRTTGGYSLEIKGLTEIDQSIFFKVGLNEPNGEDTVIQALTYPNMLIKITANKSFEAEAELTFKRESKIAVEDKRVHYKDVNGIYTGQIDNNFIEIDLSSNEKFRSNAGIPNDFFAVMVKDAEKEKLNSLKEGSEIKFDCYQDENAVWILEKLNE